MKAAALLSLSTLSVVFAQGPTPVAPEVFRVFFNTNVIIDGEPAEPIVLQVNRRF